MSTTKNTCLNEKYMVFKKIYEERTDLAGPGTGGWLSADVLHACQLVVGSQSAPHAGVLASG